MIKQTIAAVSLALVSSFVVAAERNDVPSCYAMTKLTQYQTPSSGRLLTVIIDQTTPLPKDMQKTAWGHITRFIEPGDKLRLYSFSAYLNGHYTKLEFSGELESPLPQSEIGSIPIASARKFENCLPSQRKAMFTRFGKAFSAAMSESSNDIPRSEILFSLREISEDLRKAKDVNDQVIFLLSDMLEFSEFGSFYANNTIREVNPSNELEKAKKQDVLADFEGARVYVHGAAFAPQNTKAGYRSGKTISNLKDFWALYFEASNAELKGFGTPSLTAEVK